MDEWDNVPIVGLNDEEEEEDWNSVPVVDAPAPIDAAPAMVADDDWDAVPLQSTPKEEQGGLTRQQILDDPLKMKRVRDYMVARNGVNAESTEDAELFDQYMGRMRFMNTNELRTVTEAMFINRADPETKAKAAEAYTLYEEMAPFWENGEGVSALGDYGKAILTSPSTYLGGIVGKGLVGAAGKVGSQAVIQAAKEAAKVGGEAAARSTISTALKVGAAGTAVDASLAAGQDAILQQNVLMESGAQDEYQPLQTALAAIGGLAGGAVGMAPELTKGMTGISAATIAKTKADRSIKAGGLAAPRIKNAVQALVGQVNELKKGSTDWQAQVAGGAAKNPGIEDLTTNLSWFFDTENPDSLLRIIVDSGANLKLDEEKRFAESVTAFLNDLPSKELDEINNILEPELGMKLGELVDLVSVGTSRSGSILQVVGQGKKYAQRFMDYKNGIDASNRGVIDDFFAVKDELPSPERLRYTASLWRRILVSTPATTAVNVQGWSQAYGARTMAQIMAGGIYGTMGTAGKMMGKEWGGEALKRSNAAFGNALFKAKTFMDPYGSREAFDALFKNSPKTVQDKLTREQFGGIEQEGAPSLYGIDPTNKFVKGAERVADIAAKASAIKMQDYWTKTFSTLGELDHQVRLKYGKGLPELVQAGEYYKLDEGMWMNSMKAGLQDTFSMDYTKGKGGLNKVANVVEKISDLPVAGFLFPFGRFMNNNMAFTMQYNPIGLLPVVGKLKKYGIGGFAHNADGITDDVAKATVGTVGLMMLASEAKQYIENGMQWYEKEDSTGQVTNVQNLAPESQMRLQARLLSRVWDYAQKGEAVPEDLWYDLADQVAGGGWIAEVTGGTPIQDMIKLMGRQRDVGEDEEGDATGGLGQALGVAAQIVSGTFLSGFTRPLDPLNKVVGMVNGTDAQIDRRIAPPGSGEAVALELTRYTDNLFDAFLEEPLGTEARSAARPEGDIHQPNDAGTATGRKEVLPKNYTDKLFGSLDYPIYMLDQRGPVPEFDRFINEKVAPILNEKSKRLLKDPVFQRANYSLKREMAKHLVTSTRDDVKDLLDVGITGTGDNRRDAKLAQWLRQPAAIRDQAKIDMGFSQPDRELTADQIDLLRNYSGTLTKFYNNRPQ